MTAPAVRGRLFLVPTPITDGAVDSIPPVVAASIGGIRDFVVENERAARRFLSRILPNELVDASTFAILDEHTGVESVAALLLPALDGRDMALLSEAGCPCAADPGSGLVAAAHIAGIRAIPLPGPSAILLALVASGLNGQAFAFNGYLPKDTSGRVRRLQELERESASTGRTQIFIETPYRNKSAFRDMLGTLRPDTLVTVARSVGGSEESIVTRTIGEWRRAGAEIRKNPTVFCFLAASHRVTGEGSGPVGRKRGTSARRKTGDPLLKH
ncbi:MAG: SAM-dependent methyltransferase [Spirochaetes bacterium]|nr:SAM-dependent methyltransferase [Spirochaetota bacterium]